MSAVAEVHTKLDINRVVRRALDVLQRNWRSLLRPAFLYLYLPGVLVGLFRPHPGPFGMAYAPPPAAPLLSLLALIPYALMQGGLVRLTIADLHAEPIATDDALKVGRERLWPLYGLDLLAGLVIGVGVILFIAPGVYAALAWCVVAPVLIEERARVMETFGRSAQLTRGSRLNILGLGLLAIAAELIASLALALISAPFPRLIAHALIWPALSAASGVVLVVLGAAIYDELRTRHEGPAWRSAAAPEF